MVGIMSLNAKFAHRVGKSLGEKRIGVSPSPNHPT